MEPVKILLVDDRKENLLALEAVLSGPDYSIDTAVSGEDALLRVLSTDYALILMDVQMPGMDGFATASLIRRREKSRETPIIFLTAISKTAEHMDLGYNVGAVDYVFKPVNPNVLRAKIKAMADLHRQKRRLSLQRDMLEQIVAERTSELLKANEELSKSRELIESILESITDAFCAVDTQWRLVYANKEAQRQFSRSKCELIGHSLFDFGFGDHSVKSQLIESMKRRTPVRLEAKIPALGACFLINAYPTHDGMSIYFQDVTKEKSLEREMFRLERLHLVGEMAAGIAHEIRNPMTTVRGYLQLFRGKFSAFEQQIDMMLGELDRANSIITEFLGLAKNRVSKLAHCNICQVIDSLFPLIQAEAFVSGKDVKVDLEGQLDILADQGEIRQLIVNLAKNGLEAMQPGGVLDISVYREHEFVVLAIHDQGSGIANDLIDKIGTPFFTTKEGGTGLGLAVCYSIADRHNAVVGIDTGQSGTTFRIRFPALCC
jgi:PAS domain S-box-containing protein